MPRSFPCCPAAKPRSRSWSSASRLQPKWRTSYAMSTKKPRYLKPSRSAKSKWWILRRSQRHPSGTRLRVKLAFGLIFGLCLGLAFALALEYFNTSVRRRGQVEALLHVAELAVIPPIIVRRRGALSGRRAKGRRLANPPRESVSKVIRNGLRSTWWSPPTFTLSPPRRTAFFEPTCCSRYPRDRFEPFWSPAPRRETGRLRWRRTSPSPLLIRVCASFWSMRTCGVVAYTTCSTAPAEPGLAELLQAQGAIGEERPDHARHWAGCAADRAPS